MNINMILIIELIILITVLQILPFLIYGIDKLFAKLGTFRIPEKALLATTFIFGILGSIAAMMIFKHKTSKTSFRHDFAVIAFLRIIVLVCLGLILMTIPNSSAVENFIQTLHSLFSYL
ncbi:hypothetical protein METP2_01158 [Methanosarcinales archaeon]|nr:hypothetical protein METP2_01158 [Methanosarcinales archaeon]